MQRFWDKVQKNSNIFGIDGQYPTECWEWIASRTSKGYGQFRLNSKTVKAHRIAWLFKASNIPSKLCILHKCDNPCCVRLSHLFLGTNADNIADRQNKNRCNRINPKGEKHSQAKLSERDVLAIRKRCAAGEKQNTLAKEFGVNFRTISQIVRRQKWTHI